MKTKKQLNEMVTRYQQSRSDEIFTVIYEEVAERCFGKEAYHANRWQLDINDIYAMQDDELMKAIEVYDESLGDFENLLNVAIFRKRASLFERRKTKAKHETLINSTEDETEAATFDRLRLHYGSELAATETDPQEIIASKKEADQLALIDSLVRNADSSTAATVREILSDRTLKRDFDAKAIADKVGVDRSRIKRKLRTLGRKYDSSTHGDYREYLYA